MNRKLELAKAMLTAGQRSGEALRATATDPEIGAVPKETREAVADASLKL